MNFTNFLADCIPRCLSVDICFVLLINYFVMNKEFIKIFIKVLIYFLGLVGAYFGVSTMTSCTVQRSFDSVGRGTVIISDTTHLSHGGSWFFKHIR